MKFLVDNQLPLQLAIQLRSWGLDAVHVLEVGLNESDDLEIWNHCAAENRIIVSKDEDFMNLATRPGDTGQMIWVRLGNCRNTALLASFERAREFLLQAIATGQRIIEIR